MSTEFLNKETEFLSKEGLIALVAELKNYISDSCDLIHQYNSIYEFPSTGDEKQLYLDVSTNRIYRWDNTAIKFYCVGSDYNNIEVINGGSSQ